MTGLVGLGAATSRESCSLVDRTSLCHVDVCRCIRGMAVCLGSLQGENYYITVMHCLLHKTWLSNQIVS